MPGMNKATRRPPRGCTRRPGRAWSAVAGGSCLLLLLAGCSDTGPSAAQPSAQGGSQDSITVENCGEELHFDVPPERVLLLETAPLTILDQLGLTDRIVARAGDFNPDYYSSDLNQKVSGIESLTDDLDASGHLAISQEEVVAHDPDLVLGQPDGVTREGLNAAGSQLLVQEVYCHDQDGDQHGGSGTDERPGSDAASFDTLYREIETYGEIFQRQDEAADLTAQLRDRVAQVEEAAPGQGRSAAVLYPSGGGADYAYGRGSMAHPQLQAAGLKNVFDDVEDRVFEVQAEELVARDPDVLILLYQGSADGAAAEGNSAGQAPDSISELITDMPGAESMTAVQEDEIYAHLFNFTEPASPLTVDGLELIAQYAEKDS